jgi:hypothetical protein
VAAGFPEGYAADDQAALRFEGVELVECVSAREGASCWRVERDGDAVVERPLQTRLLRAPLPPD